VPDVPTVAESGYPGFNVTLWLGFFTPKGTPPAVVKRLESELVQIAQSQDTKEQMMKQGLESHSIGAAGLGKLLKAEIENYKSVFKSAGIKMQ
jgi:tripartite-type tricarboxylate transporter receptor subunit TctC